MPTAISCLRADMPKRRSLIVLTYSVACSVCSWVSVPQSRARWRRESYSEPVRRIIPIRVGSMPRALAKLSCCPMVRLRALIRAPTSRSRVSACLSCPLLSLTLMPSRASVSFPDRLASAIVRVSDNKDESSAPALLAVCSAIYRNSCISAAAIPVRDASVPSESAARSCPSDHQKMAADDAANAADRAPIPVIAVLKPSLKLVSGERLPKKLKSVTSSVTVAISLRHPPMMCRHVRLDVLHLHQVQELRRVHGLNFGNAAVAG